MFNLKIECSTKVTCWQATSYRIERNNLKNAAISLNRRKGEREREVDKDSQFELYTLNFHRCISYADSNSRKQDDHHYPKTQNAVEHVSSSFPHFIRLLAC